MLFQCQVMVGLDPGQKLRNGTVSEYASKGNINSLKTVNI